MHKTYNSNKFEKPYLYDGENLYTIPIKRLGDIENEKYNRTREDRDTWFAHNFGELLDSFCGPLRRASDMADDIEKARRVRRYNSVASMYPVADRSNEYGERYSRYNSANYYPIVVFRSRDQHPYDNSNRDRYPYLHLDRYANYDRGIRNNYTRMSSEEPAYHTIEDYHPYQSTSRPLYQDRLPPVIVDNYEPKRVIREDHVIYVYPPKTLDEMRPSQEFGFPQVSNGFPQLTNGFPQLYANPQQLGYGDPNPYQIPQQPLALPPINSIPRRESKEPSKSKSSDSKESSRNKDDDSRRKSDSKSKSKSKSSSDKSKKSKESSSKKKGSKSKGSDGCVIS